MPLAPAPSAADLDDAVARLDVRRDGKPFRSLCGLLCPVVFDGRAAMLKLTNEPEEWTGVAALRAWNGAGVVRVLATDGRAVVLERAGRTLRAAVRDDDAASRVLCAVAARLHAAPWAGEAGLPTLRAWFSALFTWADPRFDPARAIADRLLDAPSPPVLLHGDLHHENVLRGAGERGWLAIDPKGLLGPREFDYCNLFTNPTRRRALRRFDARCALVADLAGIASRDLLSWIAAWSALSGIWHLEDGDHRQAAFPHAVMDLALARLTSL